MNRILSKHIFAPEDNDDNASSSQAQDDIVVDNDSDEDDEGEGDYAKSSMDGEANVNIEKTAKQLEAELTSEED